VKLEHKRLLFNAIDKATSTFDEFSYDKFTKLLVDDKDLSETELYDVRLYLGEFK